MPNSRSRSVTEPPYLTVEAGWLAARGGGRRQRRALELHLARAAHARAACASTCSARWRCWRTRLPHWVRARWITKQAYRWLLLSDDDRLRDALQMTVDALYADIDPERPLGWEPPDFVDQVISADWVCAQLATYELGGLDAFLAQRAGSSADRSGARREPGWPLATMGGYRLVDVQDDRAPRGRPAHVPTGPAAQRRRRWCRDVNTCVIGRVVPTGAEPGLMFESRPLTVDDTTAIQVARAAGPGRTTWLSVLAEARAAGRLEAGFSLCLPTSLRLRHSRRTTRGT